MSCEMEDLGIDFCPYRVNDNVYELEEHTIGFCEYWCGSDKPKEEELTEFVGYDEYGIPMFETVKRIPEAN